MTHLEYFLVEAVSDKATAFRVIEKSVVEPRYERNDQYRVIETAPTIMVHS